MFTSAFSATGLISRQCVVKTKRIYRTFHYNIQVALLYPTVIYPKMVMSFPDSCKQRMWLLVNRAYTMHVLISARGGEDPSFIIRRPMKLSTCCKKQLTINEIAENTNPRFSAVARKWQTYYSPLSCLFLAWSRSFRYLVIPAPCVYENEQGGP